MWNELISPTMWLENSYTPEAVLVCLYFFAAACRLSLGADSGDSSAAVCGLLTAAASAVAEPGSRVLGIQ